MRCSVLNQLMKYLIIILPLIALSCISSKDNVYLTKGTDYSSKPYQWTIGCQYDSLNYEAIESAIEHLGINYKLLESNYEKKYIWTDVQLDHFSHKPLDITILKRQGRSRLLNGSIREFENLTLYIKRNDKDFLGPLKFRNRSKAKRFLINLAN